MKKNNQGVAPEEIIAKAKEGKLPNPLESFLPISYNQTPLRFFPHPFAVADTCKGHWDY